MRVAVPKETKDNEFRVALTPAGVHELVERGHEVIVQHDAGAGSAVPDADFKAAGAQVLDDPAEVWGAADLLLKVKEPIAVRSTAGCGRTSRCSPTCTWPRPARARTRCSPRARPRSPTRPSAPRTAGCRCWRR